MRTPELGWVRLNGTVVDALTDAPIAGAIVRPDTRFGQYTTDAAGRFSAEFQWMTDPPVTVTKPGYVTAVTGCRRQGGIHCAEVVVRLVRLGRVTGNILDAHGKPAAKASVTLTSVSLGLGAGGETDEQGHFEIEAEPQSYVICAKSQQEVEREFRTPQNEAATIATSGCYPSAANPEEADAVRLNSGESTGPLTIRLGEARVLSIRGRLRTSVRKVEPWSARIFAVPDASPDKELEGQIDDHTGDFRIPALPTGMYTVVAMAGQASDCDTCGETNTFYATARVKVDRDLGDVGLTLRPKATISGQVVISGKSGPEDQPVELESRFTGGLRSNLDTGTAADRQGRFAIDNVAQGLYRLRAGTYPDFEVVMVERNGKQLDPDSFPVRSTSVSGVKITLRPTDAFIKPELSFPVSYWYSRNYWVLAIPEADWQNWDRWIESRIVSPTTVIGPMPAGSYLVLLIDAKHMYSLEHCADQIRLHRRESVRVLLKNGATESVPLRAIRID